MQGKGNLQGLHLHRSPKPHPPPYGPGITPISEYYMCSPIVAVK